MEIDFSLKEANSDEENEKFDDIKEPKLPNLTKNFKRNDLKLRVNSPMKKKTAFEKLKLIEKRDVIWLPEKTYDDRSPSKETQIDKKKTYLRTLDTGCFTLKINYF